MLSSSTSLISNLPIPDLAGSLGGDTVFLAVAFVLFMGLSYYLGRGLIISTIFAFYPATLLFKSFPFLDKLVLLSGEKLIVLNKVAIFLVFLIPITIVVSKYIFSLSDGGTGSNFLKLAGMSAGLVILVVVFSYNVVSFDTFHNFGSQIDSLFAGSGREFYWFLAPLALLAFL